MHPDEFPIDNRLVGSLVAEQFPAWADLRPVELTSSGTAHRMYRLGSELVLRFPRHRDFVAAADAEAAVLPRIRSRVPMEIPELVARGSSSDAYPAAWSVLRWIDGEPVSEVPFSDEHEAARALGEFVVSMRSIDLPGRRSPNQRGRHLASVDGWTRESIEAVSDEYPSDALLDIWRQSLVVDSWDGAMSWIHGDLLPANLLVRSGQLAAVIDFGECSIGNPTWDLVAGWWVFSAEGREVFRAVASRDDASWERARGWALSGAVGVLAYYRSTNPAFSDQARRTITRILDDV